MKPICFNTYPPTSAGCATLVTCQRNMPKLTGDIKRKRRQCIAMWANASESVTYFRSACFCPKIAPFIIWQSETKASAISKHQRKIKEKYQNKVNFLQSRQSPQQGNMPWRLSPNPRIILVDRNDYGLMGIVWNYMVLLKEQSLQGGTIMGQRCGRRLAEVQRLTHSSGMKPTPWLMTSFAAKVWPKLTGNHRKMSKEEEKINPSLDMLLVVPLISYAVN